MKNLKKFLSLGLCLTLALSALPAASAAGPLIAPAGQYGEAVSALAELRVFQGDETGLAMDREIDRDEAATVVYRVLTGDVAGSSAAAYAGNHFNDVTAGHWASGYVGYSVGLDILKGDAGLFRPDDSVTGYEMTAMLLRALNYDDGDGFTGEDWEESTAYYGQLTGVTDGVAGTQLDAPASRGLVAQLTWRALTKVALAQDDGSNLSTGQTLGEKAFGLEAGWDNVSLKIGDLFYLVDITPDELFDVHDTHLAAVNGRLVTVDVVKGLAATPMNTPTTSDGGMGNTAGLYKVTGLSNGIVAEVAPINRVQGLTWTAPGVLAAAVPAPGDPNAADWNEGGTGIDYGEQEGYLPLADGCRAYRVDGTLLSPMALEDIEDNAGFVGGTNEYGFVTVLYIDG